MSPPEAGHRVGYVLKRYPRYSETFIVNEILAHEAAGLEVHIFSLYPPSDTHFQDVISQVRAPVTYLSPNRPKASELWGLLTRAHSALPRAAELFDHAVGEEARTVGWGLELALEAQRRGLTHLHAHFGSISTNVARLAAGLAGLPYTFTAHAKDIFHESVVEADLRRKLEEAAAVVTVSDFNVAYLRERYAAAAAHVTRIYNGMDTARFPYRSPAVRPPHIVAVGRLVEKKGFADLVAACARLQARGERFRCSIIGTGELEGALRAQIADLGLGAQVELLGPRPQRELAAHLQAAAVFAAPCVLGGDGNRDGLPTVLLEAMALGTPCVSTDVTGIPEVLQHEETGLMVPQGNPEALADALARLLHDAALRVRLAERARALIERDFDLHRNAEELRHVFEGVGRGAPLEVAAATPVATPLLKGI